MHHFSGPGARWREAAVAALAACALLGHSVLAKAQAADTPQQASPTAAAPAAQPGNTATAVPKLVYRSALQSFRPWREQAPGDWRALNDEVTRIGGWRAYLREAQQAPVEPASDGAGPGAPPHLDAAPTTRPAGVLPAAAMPAASPAAPATPAQSPTAQTPAKKATPHAHH